MGLNKKLKLDLYLVLIFFLILIVYKAPNIAICLVLPILIISYFKIIVNKDITVVLILMLCSRLMMGLVIINNDMSFNIFNIICNYIPITLILFFNLISLKTVNIKKLLSLKWTILLLIFTLGFSLLNITFALSIFTIEILPLILFLLVVITNSEKTINYEYLLNFFRYSFLACLIIYLSADFYTQMHGLFANGIIFKEASPDIALKINGNIPRNMGFIFDFRILAQLSCIYLILLYYLNKKESYLDIILLCLVAISTFSRGPILILLLLFIAIYSPQKIRFTKRLLYTIAITFTVLSIGIAISLFNKNILEYVKTFNPNAKDNAISQRGMFINYSLNKFIEHPFGNGIGSLSSPHADIKVFAGYTNLHKQIPDKVFYYKIGDAYLSLSLAEKGIIGFTLLLLSFSEIFYSNKNKISLFFLIGFYINLIGTDIPKQGFYYFVIILVYYGISEFHTQKKTM